MKGNEFSARELNTDAVNWLRRLHQTLIVKVYRKDIIRNDCHRTSQLGFSHTKTKTMLTKKTSGIILPPQKHCGYWVRGVLLCWQKSDEFIWKASAIYRQMITGKNQKTT